MFWLKAAKYIYLKRWKYKWFTDNLHFRLFLYMLLQPRVRAFTLQLEGSVFESQPLRI